MPVRAVGLELEGCGSAVVVIFLLHIHLGRARRAIVDQRFQIPDGGVKGSCWHLLSLQIAGSRVTCGWREAENQAASSASGLQEGKAQRHKKCRQGKVSRLEIVHVHPDNDSFLY